MLTLDRLPVPSCLPKGQQALDKVVTLWDPSHTGDKAYKQGDRSTLAMKLRNTGQMPPHQDLKSSKFQK